MTMSSRSGPAYSVGDDQAPLTLRALPRRVLRAALSAGEPVDGFVLAGRIAVFLLVAALTIPVATANGWSGGLARFFIHAINTPFHEAGHVLFGIFGSFMRVLGGSLNQVLVPLVCLTAFLWRRNGFAAAMMLWWAGDNLVEVAIYVGDAREQELVLLGGVTGAEQPGYHDWNNILGHLQMLQWDRTLASVTRFWGVSFMLVALAWGLYLLADSRKHLKPLS
ncbi:MAG: hypothetical protein HYV63_18210 [Candidatus Schekmanbacteria bacterium]|nr:hypothetical protein [Candidatus Schekmanbacteria bacterium]